MTFAVKRVRRITGTLAVKEGNQATIPAYGSLTVRAQTGAFESPIGAQGEFYLEDLPPGSHEARIDYGQRPCRFELEVPNKDQAAIDLGNVTCLHP